MDKMLALALANLYAMAVWSKMQVVIPSGAPITDPTVQSAIVLYRELVREYYWNLVGQKASGNQVAIVGDLNDSVNWPIPPASAVAAAGSNLVSGAVSALTPLLTGPLAPLASLLPMLPGLITTLTAPKVTAPLTSATTGS